MVSRPDGLASVWKSLKPIFDKMLTMQDISKIEHLSIYNGVYGYCISADNSVKTNNEVLGYELYKKLRSYFKQHVQSLRTVCLIFILYSGINRKVKKKMVLICLRFMKKIGPIFVLLLNLSTTAANILISTG